MELLVHDVPEKVMTKLTADARRRDVSINEAVNGVLADAYDFAREPSGAKFTGIGRSTLVLDLPDELHRSIKVQAASTRGATMRGVIVMLLAAHYKVKGVTPGKRPRTTSAT
jgi:hypothetical protein